MNKLEIVKFYYQGARSELIARLQIRDNVLLLYLGAMGTLFGIAIGTAISMNVLLVIPFIALGASIIVSQHNIIIGTIATYCADEMQESLDELAPKDCPVQWELSASLHEYHRKSISLRSWGHFILILIPALAALAMNWRHAIFSPFPEGIMWWFGALCTILSGWIIAITHLWRARLYDKRNWVDSKLMRDK